MTCCHNVLLLLDIAGAARKNHVQRVALRVLNYLSCRFGLGRVRWGFQFFDSQGARSRPSRVSDFRELGPSSWEDFEEELEARFGDRAQRAHLPGPATRATHIQNVLTETLLDYQWDLPEISSPTKPFLRSSRRRLLGSPDEPGGPDADLRGLMNAVFLFSPCPHSQRELLQFVARSDAHSQHLLPATQVVMERLLPKRVREILMGRKISLYWVDTTEVSELQDSPDHLGYWTMFELFHHVGGTILPSEILAQCINPDGEKLPYSERVNAEQGPPQLQFSSWISSLPFDSTLNCLLCQSPRHQASFPQIEGTLFLPTEGNKPQQTWTVTLEPLAMQQRNFQKPVSIFLNGTVSHWTHPNSSSFGTESWILQSLENEKSQQGRLFQQLVRRLSAEELHLVANVVPGEGWPPRTGIISPLSTTATILTVFQNEHSEFQENLHKDVTENPQDTTYLLPDVVNNVLNQIHNSHENSNTSDIPVPEWAQQELGRTHPWSAAVVEKWFPFSNHSGASSNLMESFWLLQATSSNKEESSKTEGELTHFLSEFYQRKSREEFTAVGQEDNKKKRGVPGTPVRQKMKSMSRSLKMLNVARLNVKAQKLQPDCSPPSSAGEKIVQKATSRRPEEKLEERGKTLRSSKPKDFKTEEELQSHLNETYQKAVAIGEVLTHTSAQNMILAIKMFLKSRGTKDLEMTCLDRVKNYLLKTSKGLRQQLRKNLDKEAKVREYQLQVFLRLEMCLQCPSVQNSSDDMEHLVEEVTDLLRAVCLTEDPAYLSGFLEEILGLYIDSIPKTLGNLYYSLGFVIPQKLAVILPADFFSDDSMTQEGGSPTLSVHTHSTVSVSIVSDQLEELRSRSAKKRKHALTRHRSVTEAAQNLRQIEISKVPKRTTKKENFHPGHQQPPLPVKDLVQEVTKVRRNLFNQEILSPSKRSMKRLPRSHSVSAVEGLKYKADSFKQIQDYHKLLTKRVSETPLHKQVSRRLLQRQIKGRSSDPGPDIDVVEESPEKEECEMSLRRSPRIKHLSFVRTNSASFYPVSQLKPRNIQRVHLRRKNESGSKECPIIQGIRSPKRLLFGAVSEMTSPTKEKHQTKRSAKNSLASEKPIVYQTPRKSEQEPQAPTNKILRRSPRTPQITYHTPRKQRKTTSKTTSTDQMAFKNSTKDFSSDLEIGSLSEAKVIHQKGSSLLKENPSPLEKMELRTPKRQRSQTPELLETPPWSLQRNSSLANVSCPVAQFPFTIQTINTNCLTPIKHSQKTPQKSAASASPRRPGQVVAVTPLSQRNQDPNVLIHTVSQPMEYIKELNDKTTQNIKGSGHMVAVFTPPISSKKKNLFNSLPHDVSMKTPTRKSSVGSLSPSELGEFGWGMLQKSPNMTVTPLACNLISTPRKSSRVTKPSNSLPPPPSKIRKQHMNRNNSILERSLSLHQFSTSNDPTVEQRDVATMDSPFKKEQKKVNLSSPFSPKEHFHPLAGVGYEWLDYSPLFTTQNTIEQQGSDNSETSVRPPEELKMALTYEQPSASNEVASPPAKPKSPLVPSYALRRTADRRQRQAAARLADPKASPQLSEDRLEVISASPPTYEVELEMQASGLPKLRIKRVDSTSVSTENQKKVDTSLGGENFPDLGCLLRQSKPNQLEAAYVSPPCLHSSHTTPGKSGRQMYICQSYTPTHFPSSTTSPSPTDVWVSWTPSPRHKGKSTPDTIQDWPRKKKAVDSNINSCGGRNERGSDLLGNVSGVEEEGKERVFEQCISKTALLGDFELEGVYCLPDQSPSSDCEPRAEDSFSKGQFGLFSRKRPLSSQEENEHQTRRSCGSQKGNQVISADNETKEERKSPSRSIRQPSSMGDDEVFVSGSTPPNCTVRSCLSASGLRALTQSPLLYQGKAPSFQQKDIRDEEMDVFPSTAGQESPFNITISRRHPLNRTYTRKRLLS
ncbi:treslin isoform X2 [Phascolarctos cinereus]|uniref:Treslin isoform X2 n=1 Tax=Phascolarctos cinereus TaxID=38626 RepID=A0A6P5IHK6_PHACI|nr:treslin isoform X2 [Phascolarctos cinereus]